MLPEKSPGIEIRLRQQTFRECRQQLSSRDIGLAQRRSRAEDMPEL